MSDDDACDFDSEPSDWREHKEVLDFINAQSRDPLELKIQRLWVAIEEVKREMAEDNPEGASAALQDAKEICSQVPLLFQSSHLPEDDQRRLKQRFEELKREMDAL